VQGVSYASINCDWTNPDKNRYADAVQQQTIEKKIVNIDHSFWRYLVPNIRRWWHMLIPANMSAAKNAGGVAVQHLEYEICSDGNRTDRAENLEKD
jgi:hypothetical protein